MKSIWTVILLAAAQAPLSGCVIAIGNEASPDGYQWRDDGDHPRMGVTLGSVGETLASQLNIDEDDSTLILGVIAGSPAEKAGVKVHDVVVQIDGKQEASPDDLRRAIRHASPGAELKLNIIRAGQPMDIAVVLDSVVPAGPSN